MYISTTELNYQINQQNIEYLRSKIRQKNGKFLTIFGNTISASFCGISSAYLFSYVFSSNLLIFSCVILISGLWLITVTNLDH